VFQEPGEGDFAGEEEFIRGWEATRDYLQTQPGYVDTALHHAVSPDADFRFVNVGRWESAQTFPQAIQSDGYRGVAGALRDFRPHQRSTRLSEPDPHRSRMQPRRRRNTSRNRQVTWRSSSGQPQLEARVVATLAHPLKSLRTAASAESRDLLCLRGVVILSAHV